ncbi:MAG: 5-bromo-4-chloroindolyl phosphate hydrolysis family protein [Pseudomonadota bacterium]
MPEIYRPPRPSMPASLDLRGYLLLPLALPLVPAFVLSLLRGRADHVLAELLTLALILSAVWAVRRALRPELRHERAGEARRLRWLGAGALALACAICDRFLVSHGTLFSVIIAALTGVGAWLAWWPHEAAGPSAATTLPKTAQRQLAQARTQISGLEDLARRVQQPALTAQLEAISAEASEIVAMLEAEPRDVAKTRRFLSVYLQGALQVGERYERTALKHGVTSLEQNFVEVLETIQQAFREQRERLIANDVLDLDVQIEVLRRRLELEGIA